MSFFRKSNFTKNSVVFAFLAVVFSLLIFSFAPQEILGADYGLETTAGETGLPRTSIKDRIGIIKGTAVNLAGSIALAVIVFGGFLWLTAAGNQEQISKAQKVLSGGVIGIIIIYGSEAILGVVGLMGGAPSGFAPGVTVGATDIAERIGQAIQPALALVGVAFLALAVYGGFLWMTAKGNEEQVKKAQSILTSATIGAIIVLGAYAITRFVMGMGGGG